MGNAKLSQQISNLIISRNKELLEVRRENQKLKQAYEETMKLSEQDKKEIFNLKNELEIANEKIIQLNQYTEEHEISEYENWLNTNEASELEKAYAKEYCSYIK